MDRLTLYAKVVDITLTFVAATLLGVLTTTGWSPTFAATSPQHPLDALTEREYETVVKALEAANHVDSSSSYPLITLDEPAKAEVLQWKPGDAVPRRAFVIVKNGSETFEGLVDVGKESVISWKQIEGVQPGLLLTEEWANAQQIVMANRDWQAAVRKRGIENLHHVVCIPHTVGYYGIAAEEGRRLVKVVCYDTRGTKNFWGRPIEGLIAVVDHNQYQLVELIDTGSVPIPKAPVHWDEDAGGKRRQAPTPMPKAPSHGANVKVRGHIVTWHKWQFHVRIDPRLGLMLSMVRYDDHGNMRSILYQGSISELFVPYMDPDVGWYFRTYLDAGEYGVGKLAAPLQPGLDCPSNARFFEAVFVDEWGDSYTKPHAACLFERDAGDIAWRRYEAVYNHSEVRRRIELVLRLVATIGSYDYIFDWVFRRDGTIVIAVGSTGTPQVKAVKSRVTADDADGHDTAYGRMVAAHTVAINHDHFFSFRLDLDIDGPQNSFRYEHLKTKQLGPQSPRKSIWVTEARTPATEHAAKLRLNAEKPAFWRVVNLNVAGPLGYPVSYQLQPKTNAVSLLDPDDFPQRRAGFTDFHLWVTPYERQERYAAGTYPNQSKGGDGLPSWTRANRPIRNRDIVLWYTLGMHHMVRAEDWPVMPTTWSEFELRPFDFFQHNPALDLNK